LVLLQNYITDSDEETIVKRSLQEDFADDLKDINYKVDQLKDEVAKRVF